MNGNGILLKSDRIILPELLQELTIQLAQRGYHPGQSGFRRRLRYHFFFHGMYQKVKKFMQHWKESSWVVDKKI